MFTIAETARANKANPYLYFKYVLEEMPKHLDNADRSFLDAMLPWSEEYRSYEQEHSGPAAFDDLHGIDGESIELPKTPRKNPKLKAS